MGAQGWATAVANALSACTALGARNWRQAAMQCEATFSLDPQHAPTAMHVASAYAWAQDPEAAQAWAQIAQHLAENPAPSDSDGGADWS